MSNELAGFIALIIFYVGGYIVQSVRNKSNRERISQQEDRGVSLQRKVNEQETIINDLKTDLAKLSHIQALYTALDESHRLLQQDHEQLRIDFESYRSKTTGEMSVLRKELDEERAERTKAEKETERLQNLYHEEKEKSKDLESQNKAMRDMLEIFGQQVKDIQELSDGTCEDTNSPSAGSGG